MDRAGLEKRPCLYGFFLTVTDTYTFTVFQVKVKHSLRDNCKGVRVDKGTLDAGIQGSLFFPRLRVYMGSAGLMLPGRKNKIVHLIMCHALYVPWCGGNLKIQGF